MKLSPSFNKRLENRIHYPLVIVSVIFLVVDFYIFVAKEGSILDLLSIFELMFFFFKLGTHTKYFKSFIKFIASMLLFI